MKISKKNIAQGLAIGASGREESVPGWGGELAYISYIGIFGANGYGF